MRVLVETVGSAGDVHPFVAVGRALVDRGHDVTLFSNEHFGPTVEAAGLRFRATATSANYEEAVANPDLWHPTRGPVVVLGNTAEYLVAPTVDAILAEGPGDDSVIVSSTLGFAGRCAAEIARVPLVRVHLQPTAFRSVHHAPRLPGLWMPDGAPAWWKRLLYRLTDVVVDRIVCPHLNAFRANRGLSPAHRVFGDWIHQSDTLIALYPDWFAPPQPDAPRHLQHAGFAMFDREELAPLDEDLERWMRDGDPPLLFTHGSANRHGDGFFQASAAAARALGRRALLVTTEDRSVAGLTNAAVRHAQYVPFGAALRHAAAFVHHGGVGTVAQGLRAGVPQLVVPLGFDQFDNAARVEALGVGIGLRSSRYDARSATRALRRLLADPVMANAARAIAPRVDGHAAATSAAQWIESAYSVPSASRSLT